MFFQSEKAQVPAKEPPSKQLEQQIQNSEKTLGIETEYDRLIEASLFIDKKFLNYALITGVTPNPERIFGANTWADYLDARVAVKEYGSQSLTPDFILDLHKKLTQRSNPEVSGKIRSNGVIGASYDETGKPVTYTQDQVNAIEANPLLKFQIVPPEGNDDPGKNSKTGFIIYPHEGTQTQELVEKDLQEICDWFNDTRIKGGVDNFTLAATLQLKLISLHPFSDGNGTLSRLLMNWSLENSGESPSIIDEPTNDILTDKDTWVSLVKKGSQSFHESRTKQLALEAAGINSPDALFNLGQDRVFYEYIFKHLQKAPPIPTNGDKHNHEYYQKILAGFIDEMGSFQQYMSSTTSIPTANGDREITQGGLISQEIRQLASSSYVPFLPKELGRHFFSDTEVYRGGMIDGEIDDEKICQMFQGFTGVGTGYRALKASYLPATSTNRVSPQTIQESLDYYNKMIAATYLQKKHPEVPSPYPQLKSIEATLKDHVAGGANIWDSPFASTSFDRRVSRRWAMQFGAAYAKGSAHGVLFKTRVPREGIIMTFGNSKIEGLGPSQVGLGFEREVLVAGGLQPASITEIEIMDKSGSVGIPSFRAKRTESSIVIEDRRSEFVKKRTYAYNPSTSNYEFAGEEQTSTPSTISTEPAPVPLPDVGILHYLHQIKEDYSPIFIKKKELDIYSFQIEKYNKIDYSNLYNKLSQFKEEKIYNLKKIPNLESNILESYSKNLKLNYFDKDQIDIINLEQEFLIPKKKPKSKEE